MIDPDSIAPTLVFTPIIFYVLYGVIRSAVRDGILQADERRQAGRQLGNCPLDVRYKGHQPHAGR
ncbi:hypothetical protein ACP3TD_09590 [Pseudarthrobacter sp. 1G09]|uniref:hypothetical protein n=1 Tax=Pseudarthrobacter sp. 1G09 TaxID=3416178 RepID=UPI003CE9166E